jgi:hypothetical protein
LRERFSTFDER